MMSACGDNEFHQDSGPSKHDGLISNDTGKDGKPVGKDSKPSTDGPVNRFDLQVTIDVDVKLPCSSSDKTKDCVGPLIWGIWTKPATDPKPGDPIHVGLEIGAKKGTSFKGTNIPIAPKMYLNLFIDDNNSATPANLLPDKGDLVHLDLDPFTAKPGETVTRKILLWARMP